MGALWELVTVAGIIDTFAVNHGVEQLSPIPSHVGLGRPNQAHRRHPHTMGDDACAWFGHPLALQHE